MRSPRRSFVHLQSRTSLALAFGAVGAAAPLLFALLAQADEPRRTVRLPPAMAVDAAAWDSAPPATSEPDAATSEFHLTRTPPDPTPMVSRGQWIFDLRFDPGDIYLSDTRSMQLTEPQATPRVMGRFALELFEGPTLIERVRFDFPFLGATQVRDAGGFALDRRVVSRIGVIFPMSTRGTRLELRDRATEERWALPWPPVSSDVTPAAPEGGSPAYLR